MFGSGKCFRFGFNSGFVVVEWFGNRYFEEKEVFQNCFFEEGVQFGKRQRHIAGFV